MTCHERLKIADGHHLGVVQDLDLLDMDIGKLAATHDADAKFHSLSHLRLFFGTGDDSQSPLTFLRSSQAMAEVASASTT